MAFAALIPILASALGGGSAATAGGAAVASGGTAVAGGGISTLVKSGGGMMQSSKGLMGGSGKDQARADLIRKQAAAIARSKERLIPLVNTSMQPIFSFTKGF